MTVRVLYSTSARILVTGTVATRCIFIIKLIGFPCIEAQTMEINVRTRHDRNILFRFASLPDTKRLRDRPLRLA